MNLSSAYRQLDAEVLLKHLKAIDLSGGMEAARKTVPAGHICSRPAGAPVHNNHPTDHPLGNYTEPFPGGFVLSHENEVSHG